MKRKSQVLISIMLVFFSLVAIYPYFVMVMGSFKSPQELSANSAGLPAYWTLTNYNDLLKYNGGVLIRSFVNSLGITLVYLLCSILVSSMAAYSFAKFRFKGRKVVFIALLCTIMVPSEVLLPPLFLIFGKIGLIDTYEVQIFPFIANVFGMFLLRQYMIGIHDSVLESARLDGENEWGIFRKIVIPMSMPAVGAFLILQGLGKWNDFLWPAMLVNSYDKLPIMVVLPMLSTESNSVFTTPWTLVMAGSTVATLPILLLFIAFQDQVMQSVALGSVKE